MDLARAFLGHQPQLDVALLKRGWHVAYCVRVISSVARAR